MNKTPEQITRDNIDTMLERSGWVVVDKTTINWALCPGLAVREYQTDVGPADYVLFVDRKPIGVIEAKKETKGHHLSVHEQQAEFYAQSRLKWFADSCFLRFVYESTGILTQFTDMKDPNPLPWFRYLSAAVKHSPPLPAKDWRKKPALHRMELKNENQGTSNPDLT